MSAYEGSKQQEADENYAKLHGEQPKMFGANQHNPVPGHVKKEDGSHSLPGFQQKEIPVVAKHKWETETKPGLDLGWGSTVPPKEIIGHTTEQPLTHHQQAVKDFMVAIIPMALERGWSEETAAATANVYADAFINQISKK